ncbi:MAG TPA: helix-turn-helix domain-containing protein [Methylomirabilota bacterium]|nr:helix-turn-helix domain-containing protein [Methylomirabilota bacterium]
MPKKTYTITEAAKKLGISRQAVHDAIKKGLLEAEKGKFVQVIEIKRTVRGWHIPAAELEAYRKRLSLSHQERGKKT